MLITGAALIGLLVWDASGLDLTVMQGLADEHGFASRDNGWLTQVFHTRARQLAGVVLLALTVMMGWPGGRFRALTLPWLFSDRAKLRRQGQWLLLLVLFSGLVLGLAQTLRSAHYPSHTLWTAWICWIVALINHLVFNWLGKH